MRIKWKPELSQDMSTMTAMENMSSWVSSFEDYQIGELVCWSRQLGPRPNKIYEHSFGTVVEWVPSPSNEKSRLVRVLINEKIITFYDSQSTIHSSLTRVTE